MECHSFALLVCLGHIKRIQAVVVIMFLVVVGGGGAFVGDYGNCFLENKCFGMYGGYQGQGLVRQLGEVSGTNPSEPGSSLNVTQEVPHKRDTILGNGGCRIVIPGGLFRPENHIEILGVISRRCLENIKPRGESGLYKGRLWRSWCQKEFGTESGIIRHELI